MPKHINERDDIEKVEALFAERGLNAVDYSGKEVGSQKTPDLEIQLDGELVAYCEVKSPGQDTWLEDQLADAPQGEIVGGCDLPTHSSFLNKTNMRDGIAYILDVTYNPDNGRSIDLYVPVTRLNL